VSEVFSVVARDWHLLLPVGVVGVLSWSIWLIRKVLSARYRSTVNLFRTTTSVVVPSFREDPDVLERCLDSWLAQGPTEVIVVLDVEDTEAFDRLTARDDARLTVISFAHQGKRSALGVGIRAAKGEVLVLCDSDTI
jgi:hyaluronan synthase